MKNKKWLVLGITLGLGCLVACSGEVTKVGNPSGDTAPLTRLANLPELDVSRYDTSASNYSSPAALTKRATSTGQFSRVGCDSKSLKEEMIDFVAFAESFLCLYKMAEQHYPDDFTIPTDDFNYYTLQNQEDTLLGRIGYYPDGFGAIDEPVLVLDECTSSMRSAEMRVTASTVTEDLSGSGYYIRLTEEDYLGEDEGTTDESISFEIDTRSSVWSLSVDYTHDNDGLEYGTYTLNYDMVNIFNTFIAATHDDDFEGIFDISNNVAFGPSTEIEGFTVGGSAIVNVIQSPNQDPEIGQISGFVFNNSPTLPAIRLDFQSEDGSDLPYHTELTALGDPPTSIEDPAIAFNDTWDCTIPAGREAVPIDLTPDEIEQDLFECESVDEEENDDELDCAALEEENE